MKKLYLIQLLLFISVVALAQPYETNTDFNRTRNWHFGNGIGLRFDPDTIYEAPTNINSTEAAAVHTDQDGNLLLYSNGEKVWNANHKVIHNGNLTLGHHSSNLGSVFVIHEDNPDSVYLFNTYWNGSTTKEFSVNLIIKESDTFRVAFKDSVIMHSVCEPISVVKADNGKDIWVIVHKFEEDNIYSYLLTSEGIVSCPVVSKSLSTPLGVHGAYLSMRFSSNGKYLIKSNTNLPPPSIIKGIELYEFDVKNGKLKFLYSIDNPSSPLFLGLCFSENNQNIFIVDRDSGVNIFKFNPEDSLEAVSSIKKIILEGFSGPLKRMPYRHGISLSRIDEFGVSSLDFILNTDNFDSIKILEKKIDLNYTWAAPPNFNHSYYFTSSINFTDKIHFKQISTVGKSANRVVQLSLQIQKPP